MKKFFGVLLWLIGLFCISLGMFGMGNFPEMYNLIVNTNSELASSIVNSSEDAQKDLVKQALDLAKLSQGLLKGEELTAFVKRSFETLK